MTSAQRLPEVNTDLRIPNGVALRVSEMFGGDRRLDAEAYLSDGYVVRSEIRLSRLQAHPLGLLAKAWRPFPSRMKATRVDPKHGVPFVTATQVFDIWPTSRKWIAPSKTPNLADRYVTPGWILVTCSGAVGNVIMAYSAHADIVVSDDLLRLDVSDPSLRGYVYTFLRTRFGRGMMKSGQYGSVIKHLDISHLLEMPIPILDHLIEPIEKEICETFAMRDEAHKLDMMSRSRLADVLRDRPKDVHEETGYWVSASDIFDGRRRLEGNAHSPSSRFISDVYELNAESVVGLGEVAETYLPGRFKRIFGKAGTPYLDSEPIFKINPGITKFLTSATSINFDKYFVQRGWLLMACSGQTYGLNGQAIIASQWHEGKVASPNTSCGLFLLRGRFAPATSKLYFRIQRSVSRLL